MQRRLLIKFLCLVGLCVLASQLAFVFTCALRSYRLNSVIVASKIACLGTTETSQLDPEVSRSAVGSFSLPTLLLAKRATPGTIEILTFRVSELRPTQLAAWLALLFASLTGAALGGWAIGLHRWRAWASSGERLLETSELTEFLVLAMRAAGRSAMLAPLFAMVAWFWVADSDLESGSFLSLLPAPLPWFVIGPACVLLKPGRVIALGAAPFFEPLVETFAMGNLPFLQCCFLDGEPHVQPRETLAG